MPWYFYHPETREFLREAARNSRKLPNATKTAPPPRLCRGYFGMHGESVAIYDPEQDKWDEVPDFRREWEDEKGKRYPTGFTGYYLPLEGDVPGSAPRFNTGLGPMPEGASRTLPGMEKMRDELLFDIQRSYGFGVCALLELGDPIWQHGVLLPSLEMTMKLDYISRAVRGDEKARELFDTEFGDRAKLVDIHEKLDDLRLKMIADKKAVNGFFEMGNDGYKALYALYIDMKRREGREI